MPCTISLAMAAGSSLRGLSLVTTTRSASLAARRPISGRLPRSRSPPQPNTQINSPPEPTAPRSAASAFSMRVRRMRVIDDYQRRIVAAEALHASRRSLDVGEELQRALQLDAADQQGSEHTEHVRCVERADQPGIELTPAPGGFDRERQATRRGSQARTGDIGSAETVAQHVAAFGFRHARSDCGRRHRPR